MSVSVLWTSRKSQRKTSLYRGHSFSTRAIRFETFMKSRHVRWFPFQVLNITEHPLGPFQRQVTSLLREKCYSSPIEPTTRWLNSLGFLPQPPSDLARVKPSC